MKRPIPVLKGLGAYAAAALGTLVSVAALADEPVRVALLPIVVHSSGRSDYLRDGLGDMLFTRIDGRRGITAVRVAPDGDARDALTRAIAAGRSAGADYVVFGSFTRFGDGASLDLFCASVAENGDGREPPRELFIQAGNLADIIPALDGLVEKMVGFVGQNGSGVSAVSAPAGEAPNATADYDDLRRRVEALEAALAEGGYPAEPSGEEDAATGSESP